jgi:pyruvate kinase
MAEVAEAAECWPSSRIEPAGAAAANDDDRVAWAVAHAAVQAAEDLGVAAIVCPTESGTTARRVAAFRPTVPIVGSSDQAEALGRLSLVWGVRPLAVSASALDDVLRSTREAGIVRVGELVAVVSASQGKRAGSTDTVRVVRA